MSLALSHNITPELDDEDLTAFKKDMLENVIQASSKQYH
jgi:hypothetical protein